MIGEIFLQMGYYAIVMILTIAFIGILQKGFFWNFFRVKISFGKYVMVKIRAVNRDYYRVGRIEENDLVFKVKDGEKRINIPRKSNVFYRSIGVIWIDVDDEKNIIIQPDLEVVPGFDATKYNNLLVRALTRPSIDDKKDKIILGIGLLMAVLIVAVGFLVYKQGVEIQGLQSSISALGNTLKGLSKGVVIGGG